MSAAAGGELVAVYSRDQGRADAFAERHGARAAYGKLDDLLSDPRVDGVFVCSPNALHAAHVIQAAQAGKHVLCEKPMATTTADGARMVQVCRSAGVRLGVAFNCGTTRRTFGRGDRGRRGARPRGGRAGPVGVRRAGQGRLAAAKCATKWWDAPELIGGASTMMGTGVHVVISCASCWARK